MTKTQFIHHWNRSNSIAEVAKKTGMQEASAYTKAYVLRRDGAKLKYFVKGKRKSKGKSAKPVPAAPSVLVSPDAEQPVEKLFFHHYSKALQHLRAAQATLGAQIARLEA